MIVNAALLPNSSTRKMLPALKLHISPLYSTPYSLSPCLVHLTFKRALESIASSPFPLPNINNTLS